MTNPNDAVGTNGAFGGRTSVNAFNDVLGALGRGVLSGWACVPKSGMKVEIGGITGTRDVAIAEDDNGNRTTINNISELPIEITIPAAPGANTRIDAIVGYVDNPPQGESTEVDNPGTCGIIVVSGEVSSNPTAPNESAIRSAITSDGATGTSAYYAVLATVTVANGTTDITANEISAGAKSATMPSGAGVAVKTIAIVPGASNPWTLTMVRCGHIVVCNLGSVQQTAQNAADNVTSAGWNTVPEGFRPVFNVSGAERNGALIPFFRIVAGDVTAGSGQWRISDTGAFYLSTPGWSAQTQRLAGTTTWITNDPFPES